MKNIFKFFVLALASMAALASCAKNEVFTETKELKTVQVVAKHGDTKTTLEQGQYVRWSATDAVKAYGYLDNYVSTSTVVSDGGATATFTFSTGEDEILYMIYPASGAGELENNDWIGVTIPTEQTAVANGFADGANVAIGEYVNGAADFYSIGALVSFDIKNDDITSIKLECPAADCAVTGKGTAKIDEENYYGMGDEITEPGTANYVVLKAAAGQTLTKGAKYFAVVYADDYTGMKLTFTRNDGKTATFTNSKELKLDINANYTIFNAEIPDSRWVSPVEEVVTSFIFNTDAGLTALGITKPATGKGTNLGTTAYVSDAIEMTSTDGGTATRVWNSQGTTSLRVYQNGGTLTFSGATITKIEFNSTVPMTANVGTFSDKVWTGSATSVTFTATNNATISTITVTYAGDGPIVTKYDVNCATVTGGTISANPTRAEAGATVTLTATPATGYEFKSWNVTGATVADATSATTTFTMPASDVNVSATFKEIASIPDKTIAEFIAAKGGNCYLTGVVNNIKSTTYGNFDLTDASGKIYIYGCLTSEGVAQQFSTLGVEAGDKIKVLANEYEYFQSKTHEAKNVAFVEIVEKGTKYNVTVASGITNGTVTVNPTSVAAGETVTITATPNSGYKVKSVSAKKTASGTAIAVTDNKFTMPAEAVTVSAEFEVDASGETTVTWVAANASDNPGDANDWLSGSIDSNISWSATKGGNYNPKYYSNGSGLRVYNGGTFTVSAANSKKIIKVVLTFSGTSYTFSTSNTNQVQTYELDSVTSNVWSVSRTCRLQKVEVTYK